MTPEQFDQFLQIARRYGVDEFSIGDVRVKLYPMIPKVMPRPDETPSDRDDRVLFHSAK